MKVLTASQMREVDRRTMELGMAGPILMENAGLRVVEFLAAKFAPLDEQRIVILCGKGNNGGDGLVVARQLSTRFHPRRLDVVVADERSEISPAMREATIVVDALLGTGLKGSASGKMLELIREINAGFPRAKIVAVDTPSGLGSDSGATLGESVRADYTVTFTAPKAGQVLPPACDRVGELHVCPIGSPPDLYEKDESIFLSLVEPAMFRSLLQPRAPGAHKGDFGHVLVVGGSRGKTGAPAMTGMAALRAGAGLVTVASAQSAIPVIASYAPELMTEALTETECGAISSRTLVAINGKDVVALGPGLGTHPETVEVVRRLVAEVAALLVIDADGLNALGGLPIQGRNLILTPHPGEMARLVGLRPAQVQADRMGIARAFATEHGLTLVLKGQRTLIAFADGRVWVNPTGSPAMAKGGSGDILTGLIAGLLAQTPQEPEAAIAAAVYLHGRAGELGAAALGERSLIATDLLKFLPEAMHECAGSPDQH